MQKEVVKNTILKNPEVKLQHNLKDIIYGILLICKTGFSMGIF